MSITLRSLCLLALPLTAACSTSSSSSTSSPDAAPTPRAIAGKAALTLDADGQHVTFGTQNGSTVAIAKADLVGKLAYWVITPGGEPAANAQPIDFGATPLAADLTAAFTTPAHYAPGPWEVSMVIAVTGSTPPNLPAAGDLAAFDNTPPPAGEPAATGVSVRVRVVDADLAVTLDNTKFIRFGGK